VGRKVMKGENGKDKRTKTGHLVQDKIARTTYIERKGREKNQW